MTETLAGRAASARHGTAAETAVWYAETLGWTVTPAADPVGPHRGGASQNTDDHGADGHGTDGHGTDGQTTDGQSADDRAGDSQDPADPDPFHPGPNGRGRCGENPETPVPPTQRWYWAASATPRLVAAVWTLCPSAPILAVLGRPTPGAVRLGAVDVPALVGAAALERLGKNPAAVGPIVDGFGRIRFLVDLGQDDGRGAGLDKWRAAGVDLSVRGAGWYCPLPTPGLVGAGSVVWAVPPDPARPTLPHARLVAAVVDRAVRDAYPALWSVVDADLSCA